MQAIRRAADLNGLPVNHISEVRVLDPYFYVSSTAHEQRNPMKKLTAMVTTAGVVLVMFASGASAGSPTCKNMFGTGWKNHGAHVLTYVNNGGAGGGQPAHHSDDRSTAPAPGASFCLDQAKNPGLHFSAANNEDAPTY